MKKGKFLILLFCLLGGVTLITTSCKTTDTPTDQVEEYTVTFNSKGGSTVQSQTIKTGEKVNEPAAPTRTGYDFKGWYKEESCTTPWKFNEDTVKENTTLYAKWEPKETPVEKYSITYVTEHGTAPAKVNEATALPETLPTLSEDGWKFEGWYITENYEESSKAVGGTTLTSNITLYAKWTKENPTEKYSITYVSEHGTAPTKVDEATTLPETLPSLSETGWKFEGWYTTAGYTAGTEAVAGTTLTSNITLYAKWTAVTTHTLTLIIDGSTTKITINRNSTIQTVTLPSREGYDLELFTDAQHQNPFNSSTLFTEDKTLYGSYKIKTYSVTFINGETTLTTKTVNHNSTVDFPNAPSKTGYTFKGWSTNKTNFVEFESTTKITSSTTLYTYYEIQTFTVTFMDGNVKLSEDTVEYNSTAAFPSNPSKTGWVFKGWSTSSDTLVAFNSNTKITSNTTIYAYYVEEFTVTFNVDGTKTTAKVESGNKVTEPEAPSKSGYTFTGWYLDGTKFNFNTPITDSIELVANFVSLQDAPIEVTNYSGYDEGLFFEATPVVGASLSDYSVQYKLTTDSSWKSVDEELIREENNKIRCDVVGLPAGSYQVKIDVLGKTKTISCAVAAQDRSGYAHFNYTSGVGAYNDDGTLKSDAIVVYVTNETKNTVTIDGYSYTGLVNIIQNQSKIKKPLDIRIIGKITTNQYAPKSDAPRLPDGSNNTSTFFTNSLETTYGDNLVGLTVQYMDKLEGKSYKFLTTKTGLAANGTGNSSVKTTTYSRDQYPALTGKTVLDDDSYFNMLDVASASNITLEGIGTNAEFFQFGITWKMCNSIEVKNLTFTDYPEDACSFEAGSNADVNNYGHYWVHNNTFNRGKNNWDVSGERDKYAGDGGIDLKYINSVTLAYNKFDNCKKTGLVGGDNKNYTKNITFHHNYYYKVESRLPLGRQANMHIYNNYYEECGTCQDIRANAFVFSEANYFYKCTTAQKVSTDSTYTGTVIKSFNDQYDGGSKYNSTQATKVNSRTQSLTGNCKPDGSTDYSNFDTNSTLFYYTGSASNVSVLHTNTEVPDFCKTNSGVLKSNITSSGTPDPTPSGEYSITYESSHGTTPSKVTGVAALPNPLPVLQETGWTFKGWYTKNTFEESSKAVAGATLTQNVTLYAKWEATPSDTWTNQLNETFSTSSSITEREYSTTPPTTAGIYYSYTGGTNGSSTNNNVSVKNNELLITDNSDATTYGYYIFNQTYNTGKVKISIDFKPQTSNSKWAMIHFLDGASNLRVCTDSSKYLSYSIDGGTTTPTICGSEMQANATYTIILTIDYDNNTATIQIGNDTVTFAYSKTITGIMFQTAGSNARTFSVDNIKIDTAN